MPEQRSNKIIQARQIQLAIIYKIPVFDSGHLLTSFDI